MRKHFLKLLIFSAITLGIFWGLNGILNKQGSTLENAQPVDEFVAENNGVHSASALGESSIVGGKKIEPEIRTRAEYAEKGLLSVVERADKDALLAKYRPPAKRIRYVTIDNQVFDGETSPLFSTSQERSFALNLFENRTVKVDVEKTTVLGAGRYLVEGKVEGFAQSSVLVTSANGVVSTLVKLTPEEHYEINSVGEGVYQVYEIDFDLFPKCNDEIIPSLENSLSLGGMSRPLAAKIEYAEQTEDLSPPIEAAGSTSYETADVLFVYTKDLSDIYSLNEVTSRSDLAIADANQIFESNEIGLRLRSVYVHTSSYVENGDIRDALGRMASQNDGYADEIHALRDQYSADLVCLLQVQPDASTVGLAYVAKPGSEYERFGFSVVVFSFLTGNVVLPHEIGHNLGCAHDRDNTTNEGAYPYSYGYRFTDASSDEYITIMSYEPGQYIPHFSNPRISFNGSPVGVPAGETGEADNALTIDLMAAQVAGYRQSGALSVLMAAGRNQYGQLGDSTTTDRHTPVVIDSGVIAVSTGISHTLYIKSDGTLKGSGLNEDGQLGDGTTIDRHTPITIDTDVMAVSAGGYHSLYLKTDGTLRAMGYNEDGELGDGTIISRQTSFIIDTGVRGISTGAGHSLYIKTDGTLMATGYNAYGQLGNGTTTSRSTPVAIDSDVIAVSGGYFHTLYLKADGTLMAMGWNQHGQLGDGTTVDRDTPVVIDTDVIAISAGGANSLYLKAGGTMLTMGGGTSTPTEIAPSGIDAISVAGSYFSVLEGRTLSAGGSNEYGQLGDGTTIDKNPADVVDTGAIALATATGFDHRLYIKEQVSDSVPVAMSVRSYIGSGANILIPGMAFKGTEKTKIVFRGLGPTLADSGVVDVLHDPQLVIYSGQTPIATNDDWQDAPEDLAAYFEQVGLSALADGTKDSAAYLELDPGAYTMHLKGINDGEGIGLAEVYVVDSGSSDSGLLALSARAEVGAGDRVVIPGFVITGDGPRRVLIRGVGPGLAANDVPNFLVDPQIQVFSGAASIGFNEDWEDSNSVELSAAFTEAGLSAFAAGSKDAAILLTLPPGIYTAHIRSSDSSLGVALLEMYFLD